MAVAPRLRCGSDALTAQNTLDGTGKRVAIGVFVALVVDGMDLQILSLALPA